IGRERSRVDRKQARIRRIDEAGRVREYRSPRLPASIDGPRDHERKLLKELAMLLRHEIAKCASSYCRDLRAHADTFLHRAFAVMKRLHVLRFARKCGHC